MHFLTVDKDLVNNQMPFSHFAETKEKKQNKTGNFAYAYARSHSAIAIVKMTTNNFNSRNLTENLEQKLNPDLYNSNHPILLPKTKTFEILRLMIIVCLSVPIQNHSRDLVIIVGLHLRLFCQLFCQFPLIV